MPEVQMDTNHKSTHPRREVHGGLLNTKPPLSAQPGAKLRDCTMDMLPVTPLFCALPQTPLPARAKAGGTLDCPGEPCSSLPDSCSLAMRTAIEPVLYDSI